MDDRKMKAKVTATPDATAFLIRQLSFKLAQSSLKSAPKRHLSKRIVMALQGVQFMLAKIKEKQKIMSLILVFMKMTTVQLICLLECVSDINLNLIIFDQVEEIGAYYMQKVIDGGLKDRFEKLLCV